MSLRFVLAILLMLPASAGWAASRCKAHHRPCAPQQQTTAFPVTAKASKPDAPTNWGGGYGGLSGGVLNSQTTTKP
ncbi:hypothetical protein [Methylovirgula sp. 4M-Z18]|uniref:hypothetical protein n=1 Tax=Methylovirgula sp. 4M-Z18 TaxID=2293567 RepID=UPI000E3A9471|nr:hypothetical protein [Methylovirgula sp. 4M-Z18]RFB80975.1 hypothetical protein DYH55_05770 [Methylovirgula sp. 4M-Z18]